LALFVFSRQLWLLGHWLPATGDRLFAIGFWILAQAFGLSLLVLWETVSYVLNAAAVIPEVAIPQLPLREI
jgi:hypothetical protein